MNNHQYQHLLTEVKDRVLFLTLNRPEADNRLNDVLVVELRDAVLRAQEDPMVKVIVLRAAGAAFCAGPAPDYLQQVMRYNMDQHMADSSAMAQLYLSIYRSTKVVIAQVEGDALADGCGLASVCDFSFVVPEARLGFPEVRSGFVPALAMTFLLRKLGETRAKQLMLSGQTFPAAQAYQYQLITEVVPATEIRAQVEAFAAQLVTKASPAALQLTKKMIADIQDFPLENSLKFAAKMNAYARATEDCKRGIEALLEEEEAGW